MNVYIVTVCVIIKARSLSASLFVVPLRHPHLTAEISCVNSATHRRGQMLSVQLHMLFAQRSLRPLLQSCCFFPSLGSAP